jgi:phage-related holin
MRISIALFMLTPFLATVEELVNTYIFSDWNFVVFLAIAVILDTMSGFYVNIKLRNIHSFRMRSVWEKIAQYAIGLIIVHGIASHMVDGEPNQVVILVVPFIKGLCYFYMLACEAISIEENLNKIGKGILPHWISSKLLSFKETGKVPAEEKELQAN